MIPLALFSRSADEDALSAFAAAMLVAREERGEEEPGKPEFPVLKKGQRLKDFVGPSSWVFFDRVGDNGDCMRKPPAEWSSDPSYISSRKIVDALHGVNDIAERGCRKAEFYKVRRVTFLFYPHTLQDMLTRNHDNCETSFSIGIWTAFFQQSFGDVPSHRPACAEVQRQL